MCAWYNGLLEIGISIDYVRNSAWPKSWPCVRVEIFSREFSSATILTTIIVYEKPHSNDENVDSVTGVRLIRVAGIRCIK